MKNVQCLKGRGWNVPNTDRLTITNKREYCSVVIVSPLYNLADFEDLKCFVFLILHSYR